MSAPDATPLAGQVAIVTGGGRGIGRAIVLQLARAGADVVINFLRNQRAAMQTSEEVERLGRHALCVRANVGEPEGIERLLGAVRRRFPRLDILVCNAASGFNRPVLGQELRGWDWTMNINARSALFAAQAAAPLMSGGRGGHIITLSSPGAQYVLPDYVAVGASKAALEAVTRYLAAELAPFNIAVNGVSPGVVETDALRAFPAAQRSDLEEAITRATPAGRMVTPEDVARVVLFLCTPAADMIRGQIITVDGGATLAPGWLARPSSTAVPGSAPSAPRLPVRAGRKGE